MQILNFILAQTAEDTARQLGEMQKQIAEIHQRITSIPEWSFKLLWLLPLFITVAVILIFQRQKKIAQNEVDLGKMLEQLLEK